jgi:hypothetical protein
VYRDTAADLDEHDRAVGAILIGEALIDECVRAAARSRQVDTVPPPERWRAMTEVHDAYPEIWRHLDRARRVLASRGANTMAYDELRPHARRAATQDGPNGTHLIDDATLDDAKRALGELKLAVPGADWDAIDARTAGLVRAPLTFRRRQRIVVGGIVTAFTMAVLTWVAAIVPTRHTGRSDVMRHQLEDIQTQRKIRIETLQAEVGTRCDPVPVHELMKLLVLDGRSPDAAQFGDRYIDRCGEDMVVEHWANAPRPGH